MRINKPVGSKDRLVEVFQKVNHVKLNENLLEMGGVGINPENALNMAFNQLKNKKLRVEHSNTQANGSESYVEIMCVDQQGNNITFTFKTTSQEGDQDGVFNVGQVALHSFTFDSADGEETVELGDEGLKRFNQQHANEMFDVIQDYLDVEPQGAESAEASSELAEAIKLIDGIRKIDSVPFGDDSYDRMQTGKNYGDKKPTNDKVRVSSPELDKFVKEDFEQPKIAAMGVGGVVEGEKKTKKDDDSYSPFPQLGKTFKPKSQSLYPKKKKKPQTSVKIAESTDRDKYEDVVFLQGDEAFEPLERLDREGPDAALEYLKQWHYPGEHQGSQEIMHSGNDKTYEKDGYIMSWNPRIGYIGLQFDMSKLAEPSMNEGDENPELSQVEKDNPDLYPDGWKEMDGMFMGPDSPGYGQGDGKLPGVDNDEEGNPIPAVDPSSAMNPPDDGMSAEPESDEIDQLAQDKEEQGELIPGGKGEGKSPSEFSPEQILMGMKVEMEHTDDPMYALEITIDHLTEDPEYYTTKDTPEDSAQANASADASGEPTGEEGGEDKEMTDMLLGFKPHNVGDEIEDDEPEEEVPHTPETPEVAKDVQDSEESVPEDLPKKEDELGESKAKQSNLITEAQIRTAKKTLSNSNVPTGMSKKEAAQILIKHLIK